jgi:putative tricarboxylic transport membrane protein
VFKQASVAGLLIGFGLLIAAAVIGYDAASMRVPPIHAKVGPRVFPILVSCGLAVAGALLMLRARAGDFGEAEGATDWRAVGIMSGGLILHMNLLKPAGFVIAGIVLFLSVTLAFGSRRLLRDGVTAAGVTVAAYLAFTRLLGLQLPPGILGWMS